VSSVAISLPSILTDSGRVRTLPLRTGGDVLLVDRDVVEAALATAGATVFTVLFDTATLLPPAFTGVTVTPVLDVSAVEDVLLLGTFESVAAIIAVASGIQ
jgi:hypothetical protein